MGKTTLKYKLVRNIVHILGNSPRKCVRNFRYSKKIKWKPKPKQSLERMRVWVRGYSWPGTNIHTTPNRTNDYNDKRRIMINQQQRKEYKFWKFKENKWSKIITKKWFGKNSCAKIISISFDWKHFGHENRFHIILDTVRPHIQKWTKNLCEHNTKVTLL